MQNFDLGLCVEHAHLHLIVAAAAIGLAEAYQAWLDAKDQVVEGFGAGNQIKRGRQGPTLVKVGQPQLGAGKLPLHVCILLRGQANTDAGWVCWWMMTGETGITNDLLEHFDL